MSNGHGKVMEFDCPNCVGTLCCNRTTVPPTLSWRSYDLIVLECSTHSHCVWADCMRIRYRRLSESVFAIHSDDQAAHLREGKGG